MALGVISKDWFKFDGVVSDTMGLYCDTPAVPPMARRRYQTYKYGNDEDGVFADDAYENVRYTLTAYRFPMSQTADISQEEIYAWIQSAKTLEISRNYGFYFKIRQIGDIAPTIRHDGMRIDYRIPMVLSPFRYMTHNPEIDLADGGGLVENEGTRYSKPIITCQVLSTPATLTTNGEVLTINITGDITIDSERMLVYKTENGVKTACTQYTQGKLPMLSVGTNLIQGSNNMGNIYCKVNGRCY